MIRDATLKTKRDELGYVLVALNGVKACVHVLRNF